MKNLFSIFLILALSVSARAALVTQTLTITNAPVTGNTFTVGGKVLTWTNGTPANGNWVLITNTLGGDTTNLFNAAALVYSGGFSNYGGTNIDFIGLNLTASFTPPTAPTWAALSSVSVGTAPGTNVVVPISVYTAAARTNVESGLVVDIDTYTTNAFSANSPALTNHVSLSLPQTITGAKALTNIANLYAGGTVSNSIITNSQNISGNVFGLTNGYYFNPVLSNGYNIGNPFRSPGTGTGSEQFGLTASSSGFGAIAFGDGASGTGIAAVALGYGSMVSNDYSIAIGTAAFASNTQAIAVGFSAVAQGIGSIALGTSTLAPKDYSIALGVNSATTTAHQIMMGTASEYVQFPGNVFMMGNWTNLTTRGTNIIGGLMSFTSYANTALANTYNANITIGTNVILVVSGPTAAFTNAGFNASVAVNNQQLQVENYTGYPMTFLDESGIDSAANRFHIGYIYSNVNNPGVVTFQYKTALQRWVLVSHN